MVETNTKLIERCLLMTTDPGDLVLNPTCGSGTTAYVAEQWGRRWITCDTSRVALALAKQRLLTARFTYYRLRPLNAEDLARNPKGTWLKNSDAEPRTFQCKTVPHITLKSIARNASLDPIFAKHEPILAARLAALNAALAAHVTDAVHQQLAAKLGGKARAEGERESGGNPNPSGGDAAAFADRRVAVSIGPEVGNLTAWQVENVVRSANRQGYDEAVFAAFGFDAAAARRTLAHRRENDRPAG